MASADNHSRICSGCQDKLVPNTSLMYAANLRGFQLIDVVLSSVVVVSNHYSLK
jgi:hypothetical protein